MMETYFLVRQLIGLEGRGGTSRCMTPKRSGSKESVSRSGLSKGSRVSSASKVGGSRPMSVSSKSGLSKSGLSTNERYGLSRNDGLSINDGLSEDKGVVKDNIEGREETSEGGANGSQHSSPSVGEEGDPLEPDHSLALERFGCRIRDIGRNPHNNSGYHKEGKLKVNSSDMSLSAKSAQSDGFYSVENDTLPMWDAPSRKDLSAPTTYPPCEFPSKEPPRYPTSPRKTPRGPNLTPPPPEKHPDAEPHHNKQIYHKIYQHFDGLQDQKGQSQKTSSPRFQHTPQTPSTTPHDKSRSKAGGRPADKGARESFSTSALEERGAEGRIKEEGVAEGVAMPPGGLGSRPNSLSGNFTTNIGEIKRTGIRLAEPCPSSEKRRMNGSGRNGETTPSTVSSLHERNEKIANERSWQQSSPSCRLMQNEDSSGKMDDCSAELSVCKPAPLFSRMFASRFEKLSEERPHISQPDWSDLVECVRLFIYSYSNFRAHGFPLSEYDFIRIPSLGASESNSRPQKVYKAVLNRAKRRSCFVKLIPMSIWCRQWKEQYKWRGENVVDSENYVMEAAVCSYLTCNRPPVCPPLMGIVQIPCEEGVDEEAHVAIVTEFYGENLADYMKKNREKMRKKEKVHLQFQIFQLVRELHNTGFTHLDLTPENILIGREGLKLCDFGKATPAWTFFPRHVCTINRSSRPSKAWQTYPDHWTYLSTSQLTRHVAVTTEQVYQPFESCEPTIGKGPYMPPECWKIYWELERKKIFAPLPRLSSKHTSHRERSQLYFIAQAADVYMIGILFLWIWCNTTVWNTSDIAQDRIFRGYIYSRNINIFPETRNLDLSFKLLLTNLLNPSPTDRFTLAQLGQDLWWLIGTKN